jgi:hypothetical protein
MATINLITGGTGLYDHQHILEDITDQADGYKFVFNTTYEYIPGTLEVVYVGITYTVNNDFTESGPQQFTLVNGDPFPPEVDCPLYIRYRRVLPPA